MWVDHVKKRNLIFFLVSAIILSSPAFAGQLQTFSGRIGQSGQALSGGNITITIYDSQSGGSLVWNSSDEFLNSISNGYFDLALGSNASNPLSLVYGRHYWLDMEVNGEDINWSGNGRMEFEAGTGTIGNTSINSSEIQKRVFEACSLGWYVRQINEDGSVVCQQESTNTTEVSQASGWIRTGNSVYLYNSSDYVGVGTSGPTVDLDVNGSLRIFGSAAVGEVLYANASTGYVGVGTTEPKTNLQIKHSPLWLNTYVSLLSSADSESGIYFSESDTEANYNTTGFGIFYDGNVNKLFIKTGGTFLPITSTALSIDRDTHNTGIDVESPSAKLHVNGSLKVVDNSGGIILYADNATKSVGIGTVSPSQRLGVNGSVNISGNLTASEVFANINASFIQNEHWIDDGEVADINVNHSNTTDFWAGLTGFAARWFYGNSNNLDFNESLLNQTIEALDTDTDTRVVGDDVYLFNDSTTMYLNESKLNATIEALDTDTHVGSDNIYLYNDSTTMYLNETKLNATIEALDTDTDTRVVGDDVYLFNDSSSMHLNESRLNATIEALDTDTDTRVVGDDVYLYNDSSSMHLNESRLNLTIDLRDDDSNCSVDGSCPLVTYDSETGAWDKDSLDDLTNATVFGGDVSGSYDALVVSDSSHLHNCSNILGALSDLCTIVDTDTDTRVVGDDVYLFNDSTTMYLNESKLNATIEALDTDTHVGSDNIYLYNDSTTMYLNETKLNATIEALDTDTIDGTGGWINDSATTSVSLNMNVSDKLFVNATSGSVGIGIDNTSYKFQIALGENEIAALNDNSSASGLWGTNIGLLSQNSEGQIVTTGARDIVFYIQGERNTMNNGVEAMRIGSSGNIGIGTNSPSAKLDINGSFRVVGPTSLTGEILSANATSGYVGVGTTGPKTNLQIKPKIPLETDAYLSLISDVDGQTGIYFSEVGSEQSYNQTGVGIFYDGSLNYLFFKTGGLGQAINNVAFSISRDTHNTGIDVKYPDSKLHVNGSLKVVDNSGNTILYVDNSTSRVGVKTSSPSESLEINGSLKIQGNITSNISDFYLKNLNINKSIVMSVNNNGTDTELLRLNGTDSAVIVGAGTPSIVVDTVGNVGIGITTPLRALHINDTIRIEPRSSAPSAPAEGDIYFDSDLHKPCYYNSTDWVTFDGTGTCS